MRFLLPKPSSISHVKILTVSISETKSETKVRQYEIKISSNESLKQRSFISITIDGKRHKEYTGNKINLNIEPNKSKNLKERNKLLKLLEFEYRKAIEDGRYVNETTPIINAPNIVEAKPTIQFIQSNQIEIMDTARVLQIALNQKLSNNLSKYYKRNLKYMHDNFINFLTEEELKSDIRNIKRSRIQEFLNRYNSSGTYYMDKRRDLAVLFSQVSKDLENKMVIVKTTDKMRSKASLHKIYSQEQLRTVLKYLKTEHPNLYLCCLLSYGCFLRPHKEIRSLYGGHFKKDFTEIHLSGMENKSGRVRTVYMPDYVRNEVLPKVENLKHNENLFTGGENSFNEAYFNTAWTRQWYKMHKLGIIEPNQTIYSFRHTAAVNVYNKSKDIHILQQLLGHSDMVVTMKYLRGLGELNGLQFKEYLPTL